MPPEEFAAWLAFYKLHPFDDYHRIYRPAAHIAQAMAGGEIDERLDWLEKRTAASSGYSAADLATMKAFGVKPPMRKG